MQAPRGHVDLDEIAIAHQRERAARSRFRRYVQYHGAIGRAAHARIGDSQDVGDAPAQ
jgi:hypothetical protein